MKLIRIYEIIPASKISIFQGGTLISPSAKIRWKDYYFWGVAGISAFIDVIAKLFIAYD